MQMNKNVPHQNDFFDSTNDRTHERLEFGVVVQVVSVADAHEQDVSWQAGNHVDHHTFGLQVCQRVAEHLKNMTRSSHVLLKLILTFQKNVENTVGKLG